MIEIMGGIGVLLEFMMNNKAPFNNTNPLKPSMGQTGQEASFILPYDILSYFIRCTVTPIMTKSQTYPPSAIYTAESFHI